SSWVEVNSGINAPSQRHAAGMAFDQSRGLSVLFGGFNGSDLNDTWTWNGSVWTQLFPANNPSRRSFMHLVYDSARQRMLLYGGCAHSTALNDTWEWNGTNWSP